MKKTKPDVVNQHVGGTWAYTETVRDHFFQPKNLLWEDPDSAQYDAEGMVGSPACGDVMRIWLKIDKKTDRIKEFKWRTFGCASAIAATSMLSVMVTEKPARHSGGGGMKIDQALKIRPQDIMKRLGGLPDRKIHCSVLGDKGLRAALNDWFKKTNQLERVVLDGARVVDPETKVTEADIEEAVLEGATNLEEVQKRTKVGIGNPDCLPKVEELIRFYSEKYFGKMTNEEKVANIINKVRPYIQMHGGDVEIGEINEQKVTLLVSGACSHCSLASMTYNNLIGGLLKEEVPELALEIIYQ